MEEEIDLRQYVEVLSRHWKWIVGLALVAAISAFVVSSWMAPVYSASVTLLVHQSPSAGVSDYSAILMSEKLARTYTQMLSGHPVLESVIAQLELEETPKELAERVDVELVQNTQLIRLNVEDTHPVRAAQIADAIADAFITQNQALQQERYADSLTNVQQQMDELAGLVEETETALDDLGTPETAQEQEELTHLQNILAGYRNTYATLLQNYEQMRLTAAQSVANVIVFEAAQAPKSPVRPRKMMNTALAGVMGAMLAVGMVFLVEYLDNTIKTPDDVSQTLGLGTMGSIGHIEAEEEELVVASQPLSHISEAFRVLRTNIRFSSVDKPLRTILVTSPAPSEGKSITVANLAAAMAQAGLKVVVIDADLRRPRLHQVFGLHPRGGLCGALLEGNTDGRLQPSQVEGLMVLPAGEPPPNPAELLGSQRMRDLLDEATQEADVVLIDSPPVLVVTDAAVLAQNVDGVLLVVDAGETRREAAQHAVESLTQVGANLIGVVLNKVAEHRQGYYYYHSYYGNGDGDEQQKRRRRRERRENALLAAVRRLWGRNRKAARPAETD